MRIRTIDTAVEALPTRPRTVETQRVKVPVFNGRRHIIILGRGKFAKTCWDMLAEDPKMARRVIGFVQGAGDQPMEHFEGPGVVGGFEELPELVERYQIGMIAVCLDDHRAALPVKTLLDLKVAGIEVIDGHRLFEQLTGRLSIDSLRPSALIFSAGFNRRAMTMLLKRTVDVVVAAVSLVLTAPLLLLVACLIKMDSPGPVFYRQLRVGLKANPFMIVKFRSMVQDAEAQGPRWAQDGDPRVSRVGRWLRKWRIDEFPQFINVLKGEMSIVGPRPERPVFVQELRKQIPYYDIRHTVRPGITGWAQVMFRYASSREDSHLKLQYDLYYVKNLSVWLDLKTLVKTIRVLAMGEGAR